MDRRGIQSTSLSSNCSSLDPFSNPSPNLLQTFFKPFPKPFNTSSYLDSSLSSQPWDKTSTRRLAPHRQDTTHPNSTLEQLSAGMPFHLHNDSFAIWIRSLAHRCRTYYVHLRTYIHTYHTIPLQTMTCQDHYIPLHTITYHYIPLHSITYHYIPLHTITFHYITLHYITYIH